MTTPSATSATGLGSWPGTDVREAVRIVRGELTGEGPEGTALVPYLPELPARGPGADLLGRTAYLLVDLPVDLQPQGWRLVDRPGRDHERTASLWRQDLDELAEAFDGYAGPLKVQVAGPWTLAASLWLPLGDRVLADRGATRDLAESLAEGVRLHLAKVQALVPGARLVLQVDEPSLPAVLAGRIRSASGYRTLRTPERGEVVPALARVLDQPAAEVCGVHSCAPRVPVDLLGQAGARAISLDLTLLDRPGWEHVAAAVEGGTALWAGLDVLGTDPLEPLLRGWRETGLDPRRLLDVTVTPTCGLAGADPQGALRATQALPTLAARLMEVARA